MPSRIEDYALIGDCNAAALVARDGSIDWLCWPRFDSEACFAALLGTSQHGRWLVAPRDAEARVARRYRRHTMILETRFECRDGAVTLVDFMPMGGSHSNVVRLVIGERGQVAMGTELILRFGYGSVVPWMEKLEDGTLRAIAGPDMVVLRTPVVLAGRDLTHAGEFTVAAGEMVPFVLTYGPSHLPLPTALDAAAAPAATEVFWSEWAARCRPAGRWSGAVVRSVITLKALTYAPTGGMVAAPTTSLPEQLGGARNWDYRFCWLRDATFTLLATMNAGYYEEAGAWRDWLVRAVAGSPHQAQILYGIAGERRTTEWEVPWLPGYEGSLPVRIGNMAHEQLQLDVYGEVLDAFYQARRGGLPFSQAAAALQVAFLEHLAKVWREPDESIWEVRGGRRQFTYSKLMSWVAFDRAVKSHEIFGRGDHARATAGGRCAPRFTPTSVHMASMLRSAASCSPTAAPSSTRASCKCRFSASCRSTIRAWSARWRRSSATFWWTASCCVTAARPRRTDCRQARGRSWPAASGWSTPMCCSSAARKRARCSSGWWGSATTSVC